MNLKMKSYKGGGLKGSWLVTKKLDGVCVILDCAARTATSKRGKPLHNFEKIWDSYPQMVGTFEVFRDDWETSVSLVRTMNSPRKVQMFDLNILDQILPKMQIKIVKDPTDDDIKTILWWALDEELEGLVLVPMKDGVVQWDAQRIKVKDEITVDIKVTGIQMGTGKYAGMVGALLTNYGKVGTGFNDSERKELLNIPIGTIIEVGFMEWTSGNKMRHPRFKRVRFDKSEENLEGFKGDIE